MLDIVARGKIGQDTEDPSHKQGLLDEKPRTLARALPPARVGLGGIGRGYVRLFAAGSRSVHREIVRTTVIVELFGETAVTTATNEVMRTGHVDADYAEHILRHKRDCAPQPPPCASATTSSMPLHLRELDLGVYDRLVSPALTRNPARHSTMSPGHGSKSLRRMTTTASTRSSIEWGGRRRSPAPPRQKAAGHRAAEIDRLRARILASDGY